MIFLKLLLVECVSYGLFRRNFSPGYQSPNSKQFSLHDERTTVAPGEVLYTKPVPILQNFRLFDEHNSDSEIYTPATYNV
ncbi:hypothetical protein TUBRATIS_004840 [Tubulinosema ratisbonensis]|uniref:Uncharacterized protein n=1 Tax=Tubulinosema ratisbonensis TaxID=291195 RepID=A0A437APQ0_9MICR|nr:hypothetical protein TUBRATIS_004840 [Tubulinosema ratisbonensis]